MPLNQRMVLYVDDEESDLLFMQRAFHKAGLDEALETVGNGQEAIDYLAGNGAYGNRGQHPVPAVVVLDLNLPRVSGFDVLKWIRQRPELTTLPVVVFSSSSREEDRTKARDLGANDFIEKPGSMGKFGEVVERLQQRWLGGAREPNASS